MTLGAKTVTARIGYNDKHSVAFLAALLRLGIWKILERPMFTKLRHSLLYNPGEGGAHKVTIQMTGTGLDGKGRKTTAMIVDSAGQTHLTALGAVVQIERVLGLQGNLTAKPGITFPEKHENLDLALKTLKDEGVIIRVDE